MVFSIDIGGSCLVTLFFICLVFGVLMNMINMSLGIEIKSKGNVGWVWLY